MSQDFRLIMISAMYENGGNTTQRLLDGHPELFSYPFESQLGTRYVQDHLSALYPLKYRWPVFPLDSSPEQDYETIIDEECKVRIKTPQSSKFREYPLSMDDCERKRLFVAHAGARPRTRANLVEAFFRASSDAWRDCSRSGRESVHVGYSPIVGVDADKIVLDSTDFYVLNVVRNPWSAYADTKKRPVPLPLAKYMIGWMVHQHSALTFTARYPGRVFTLRYEDIIEDPVSTLSAVLARVGAGSSPTLARPSWNGTPMTEVYPWGTIRAPNSRANKAAMDELSPSERDQIRQWTEPLLARFGYE